MLNRRVTQVTLVRTLESGDEQWLVEWTEVRKSTVEQSVRHHATEAAARRHVDGLLNQRAAGLFIDGIFTERL